MARRYRDLIGFTVVSGLLAGCASGGGSVVSPASMWLQAWAPPADQTCSVVGSEPLPALNAVFDSAQVARAVQARAMSGAALFSVSVYPPVERPSPGIRVLPDTPPVPDSVQLVESDMPAGSAQELRGILLKNIRMGVEAGFLLRADAGPEPRFRMAHHFECRPVLRNGDVVRQLLTAAAERGLEGRANVQIFIREDGTVGKAAIHRSAGDARVDEALLGVARAMQFHPARLNRIPVAVPIAIPLAIGR